MVIFEILLYVGGISLLILYGYSAVVSKRKNKSHIKIVEELIREGLKNSTTLIQGPTKLKSDSYEFRCSAKNHHVGVLTVNYDVINDVFPMSLLNKAFKIREKLFIGLKFKTSGRTISPNYRFDIIPYTEKTLIRENFKEYIKYDDMPTSNSKIEKNFMIKSANKIHVEHFTQDNKFQEQIIELQDNYKHLKISPGKQKTDPHMQMVLNFRKEEVGYIIEALEHFMNAAELHINNRGIVEKRMNANISTANIKKTKSAKIRRYASKQRKKGSAVKAL